MVADAEFLFIGWIRLEEESLVERRDKAAEVDVCPRGWSITICDPPALNINFTIQDVLGDGNCMFRSCLYALGKPECEVRDLKKRVIGILPFFRKDPIPVDMIQEEITNLLSGGYPTELSAMAIAFLLNCQIITWTENARGNFQPTQQLGFGPTINIIFTNMNSLSAHTRFMVPKRSSLQRTVSKNQIIKRGRDVQNEYSNHRTPALSTSHQRIEPNLGGIEHQINKMPHAFEMKGNCAGNYASSTPIRVSEKEELQGMIMDNLNSPCSDRSFEIFDDDYEGFSLDISPIRGQCWNLLGF